MTRSRLLQIVSALLFAGSAIAQNEIIGGGGGGGGSATVTAATLAGILKPGLENCIPPTQDGSDLRLPLVKGCLEPMLFAWKGLQTWEPSATQAISDTTTKVLANANSVAVNPASNITVAIAPNIDDGQDGQPLQICNINATNSLTLQDEGTLTNSNLIAGGANVTIGPTSCKDFVFYASIAKWVLKTATSTPPIVQPPLSITGNTISTTASTATAVQNRHMWTSIAPGMTVSAINMTTANVTYFERFSLESRRIVRTCTYWRHNNVASSTHGFAFYNKDRNVIWNSGAIQGATGGAAVQVITNINATLEPGVNFYSWAGSDTTMQFMGISFGSTSSFMYSTPSSVTPAEIGVGYSDQAFSPTTGMPNTLGTMNRPGGTITKPQLICFMD